MHKRIAFIFIVLLHSVKFLFAQDKICHTWYTDGRTSAVEIFLGNDGKYYGKIVWLRDGIVKGKPITDTKNPEAIKRSNTWLGLQIIAGMVKKSTTEYVTGKIYDPSTGNYYHCKMTVISGNKLELRGYVLGIPFLGRTTTWYLKEENIPPVPVESPTITNIAN